MGSMRMDKELMHDKEVMHVNTEEYQQHAMCGQLPLPSASAKPGSV